MLNIIFIGMSGFLIQKSFTKLGSKKAYLQKRLLRIYPAYWVSLLLIICINGVFSIQPRIEALDILVSITGFQYLLNFNRFGIHLWFVATILICYIIFLPFHSVVKKRPAFFISLLIVLFIILSTLTADGQFITSYEYLVGSIYNRISEEVFLRVLFHVLVFFLGVFLASSNLLNKFDRFNILTSGVSFAATCSCFLLIKLVMKDILIFNYLAIILSLVSAGFFILFLARLTPYVDWLLKCLSFIADISFEFYLIHPVVILLVNHFSISYWGYPAVFVLSILLATLANRLVKSLHKLTVIGNYRTLRSGSDAKAP